MISINPIGNSTTAAHYYSEADYYAENKGDGIESTWRGNGAQALGISGSVNHEDLKSLMEGELPDGTLLGRVNADGNREHKRGWDFTLSAPKSVSVLALAAGDVRLIKAHNDAVDTAMAHMEERYAVTRQGVDGETRHVNTGNLTIGSFTHTTSRAMDPQLHTHNVVMNMTQRSDGSWRSVESRRLYDASMKIGLLYQNELAANVKSLGYAIEVNAKNGTFEINSVPQHVIDGFSKRRAAILQAAKDYGYTTVKGMDNAAVRTRQAKQKTNQNALKSAWSLQMREMDFKPEPAVQMAAKSNTVKVSEENKLNQTKSLLDFARRHLSEREAVFTKRDLEEQILRAGLGHTSTAAIDQAIRDELKTGELVSAKLTSEGREESAFTTPNAIKKENYIISMMNRGKGEVAKIASRRQIAAIINDRGFTAGQEKTVRNLLSGKDRVMGVQGDAGTGKTYMLTAVREIAEKNGYTVKGLSPTGAAAGILEEETGIRSHTLASHLMSMSNSKTHTQNEKEILVVDESSLETTQDAADLLTYSRKTRSRVIMVGDKKQMGAVEAGKPFEMLINAGMNHSTMSDILRQRENPALLMAVNAAIDNRPHDALGHISSSVEAHENVEIRVQRIVDRVMNLPDKEREQTLVLIPDNETRAEVNTQIRRELQNKGVIEEKEIKLKGLVNRGLTRAEKARAQFYEKGDVVVFGRDFKTLSVKSDTPYTVVETGHNQLRIQNTEGQSLKWSPHLIAGGAKNGVELYSIDEKRALSVGDKIRWRRRDKGNGIKNTEEGVIKVINAQSKVATIEFKQAGLKNLDMSTNQHWEHNYASTVYSGQGATYKQAIVHAESWRRNLINQKSFYVGISRAKFQTHIVTDHVGKLANSIAVREGSKTSALQGLRKDYTQPSSKDGVSHIMKSAIADTSDEIKERISKVFKIQKEKSIDLER